ncbi:MAG: glutamine synthetase III, partial [Kiritimatiellae bacterium]|nr:glutamine synthetase III [Kiritimatiellia bacterium]
MNCNHRMRAVEAVAEIRPLAHGVAEKADFGFFGEDVFGADAMRRYLPEAVCGALLRTIGDCAPLDPAIAGDVATAMRDWAIDRGATHYTHWFLPLNGATAEKHDAFLDLEDGRPILAFSAKNLIVGEPDASSFPSGGLRSTFEARGYTAWDPTSPAFIKRHSNGATLCIPTAFFSFSGESLDKKTPLLRSRQALAAATKRLMGVFGLPDARVSVTLGAEQEYFLIDRRFYLQRPDLVLTGRTVVGAPPEKHQQLEDHYFGLIKMRAMEFMTEVERELWRLGIPAKTRHNETAPAQFELAPVFEDVNLACDHNMLIMEVLRQAAKRHGLACLLHEKPFGGVNGSGKHNNWSISYGGRNLLNPGGDPAENAVFLTVLAAILMAVDRHADLLRATVAGAGNDHRLGASEAPPAIVSVFLGDQLTGIIDAICGGTSGASRKASSVRIGVDAIPPLPRDATDRNRTSPFAFTGNKFEFRAPGASQSCAGPCTILNLIVADAFDEIASRLEKVPKERFNASLQRLLREIFSEHRRIVFNGDGYGAEWVEEASRRGLPNLRDTPAALAAYESRGNIALCSRYGVYSERELASRHEIFSAEYASKIKIEGGVALELATTMILPAAEADLADALATVNAASAAGLGAGAAAIRRRAEALGGGIDALSAASDAL